LRSPLWSKRVFACHASIFLCCVILCVGFLPLFFLLRPTLATPRRRPPALWLHTPCRPKTTAPGYLPIFMRTFSAGDFV
jgi:hypothetical protein